MRLVKIRIAGLLLLPLLASAQGNKPIIDNDRVIVWDSITWTKRPAEFCRGGRSRWRDGLSCGRRFQNCHRVSLRDKTGDAVFC